MQKDPDDLKAIARQTSCTTCETPPSDVRNGKHGNSWLTPNANALFFVIKNFIRTARLKLVKKWELNRKILKLERSKTKKGIAMIYVSFKCLKYTFLLFLLYFLCYAKNNKIRTFWVWKLSKNKSVEPHQNTATSYKKGL